jgi:hypothetical protein
MMRMSLAPRSRRTTCGKEGRGLVARDHPLPHAVDQIQPDRARSGIGPPPPKDVGRGDRSEPDGGRCQWGWAHIGPSVVNARREREPHHHRIHLTGCIGGRLQ